MQILKYEDRLECPNNLDIIPYGAAPDGRRRIYEGIYLESESNSSELRTVCTEVWDKCPRQLLATGPGCGQWPRARHARLLCYRLQTQRVPARPSCARRGRAARRYIAARTSTGRTTNEATDPLRPEPHPSGQQRARRQRTTRASSGADDKACRETRDMWRRP